MLQSEVRLVKNSVSATGRKIERVKSEIEQTKASLSYLDDLSPISTSTALISLKSFKSSNTTSSNATQDKVVSPFPSQHISIPDILIEPVSDCDAISSVLEIEPISDCEVSEGSQSTAANLLVVEAVSDAEMDTSSSHHTDKQSNVFDSAFVSEENRSIEPLSNSVEEAHTSIITKTCQTNRCSNPSQSTTGVSLPEAMMDAQAASDCVGSAQIIVSSKYASANTANYSNIVTSESPKPGSEESVFVLSSQEERSNAMQCSLPQTSITSNAFAWSTLQRKPQSCIPVTETRSVPNLVPVDKIFYTGTSNLFSLGNEPPYLAVSVNNVESLDVESACINEAMLKEIQQKAIPPYVPHSCNPTASSVCSPSTSFRNRKQKNPLHMTLKRKAEMLCKERSIEVAQQVSLLKVGTSSSDNKTAECGKLQGAKKRKQSLKNMGFKIPGSKRMKSVDNQAKTCFQVTDEDHRESSGVDKATVTLQKAFESVVQRRRPLKSTQVLKLIQATGSFPASQATHSISTCSQVDISTVFSRSKVHTDQSSPSSVVRMSATYLDVPRSTSSHTKIGAVYTPYSSPLLSFSSYMLSPAYRQQEKLQLSSITHSCKLNPKQVLCKFDLLGVCKDPKCNSQHLRQVVLSNKEIVARLVTHTPKMAQCTPSELEIAEVTQPEYRKLIANKISKYASSVVERYSPKLSDEEIYQFTAHEVNKAMAVDDPRHGKHHFVSFSDRGWLFKTKVDNQFPPAVGVNIPELDVSYPDIASSGDSQDTPKRYSSLIWLIVI